jgi:hypothetical protein
MNKGVPDEPIHKGTIWNGFSDRGDTNSSSSAIYESFFKIYFIKNKCFFFRNIS